MAQERETKNITLINAIKKHNKGLQCVWRFRALLKQILPFKEELIDFLVKNREDLDAEISLFMMDRMNLTKEEGYLRKLFSRKHKNQKQ